MKIQRILTPIDFSPASRDELHFAIGLASEFGAELITLHVISTYAADAFANKGIDWGALRERVGDRLRGLVESEGAGIVHRWHVVAGIPAERILYVAKREKVDLVVMSTTGRTGLSHAILGSVTETVIRRSSVPVITFSKSAMVQAA